MTAANRRTRSSTDLSELVDRLKRQFPEVPHEELAHVAAGDDLRLPSVDRARPIEPEPTAPRRQHRA
jgi:hypothetical protein